MRTIWKIIGLALLGGLAGCSSSGPKITPAKLVEFTPTLKVEKIWTASIGGAGRYTFTPALAGEYLYVAGANGSIAKLSVEQGKEIWRINADTNLTAGIGSDGKYLAVAAEKGALLVYDADGKFLWKAQASSEVLSAPVVGAGLVIVRCVNNRVEAYDVQSGKRSWTLDRPSPALTLRSAPGMMIVGPTIVVALPGGRLLSLNLKNGGPRWEVLVGEPSGATELERIADLSGEPSFFNREVCAAAYTGRVACVDVVTGQMKWHKNLAAGSSVGVSQDERYVYAVDEKGAVYAMSSETGQSVWRNDKLAHRGLSTPVALGRYVAVVDYEGYMHFMSRENGAFATRLSTGSSPVLVRPVLARSTLIVQSQSGDITAFGAR